ncbi:MAG TPA: HK97 family phage prohead protease [Solirubrobacterales bacterium]|nr:HK97 family phage prohead protease [Solirubrobacterales bacterium]
METKSFAVTNLKALGDSEPDGTFEAIVAVFGNVDRYGDRVESGAFAESLKKGFPPIVWSHDWLEPPIGVSVEAKEVTEGLYIKGRLFIEENDLARKTYAAMKNVGGDGQPPLKEFSFSYDIVNGGWVVEDEEEIFSLKELAVIEVGPCLKGVNEETRLIGVKSEADQRERPPRLREKSDPEPDDDKKTDDELEAEKAEARSKAVDLLTVPPPPLA